MSTPPLRLHTALSRPTRDEGTQSFAAIDMGSKFNRAVLSRVPV